MMPTNLRWDWKRGSDVNFCRLSSVARIAKRGALVLALLLCVAVPSWTASVIREGYSIEEARTHYIGLEDDERELIHKRYEHFSSLTQEERDDLRLRGRNLARISEASKSEPLPPEVATELEKLSPRERRKFQRSLLTEELREKGRKLLRSMPERSQRQLKESKGPRERAAFMRRYKNTNVTRIVDEMIRRTARRLDVSAEETQRIFALPKDERLRAFLELNVGLTEEEMLRNGLPFGITPEQWEVWRELSAEEFYAAVVDHREKKLRKLRKKKRRLEGDEAVKRPEAERLAGLKNLLEAVRKRPRDFVELADLERGRELRLELGKRKRSLCTKAIRNASLVRRDQLTEIEYLSDGAFASLVRTIIDGAGGPDRIDEWSASTVETAGD